MDVQKDQGASETGAFVPVDERMVPAQVEGIGRGHLKSVPVKPFTAEGRPWHSQRRFQKSEITHANPAPVALDLVNVNDDHTGEVEEG